MGSFASEGEGDNQNSIVPKFDSATQISDRDKVEFRISLIRDEDVRREHELALVCARDDIKDVDQRYALAEARFVDQNLKHDPSLTLSLAEPSRAMKNALQSLNLTTQILTKHRPLTKSVRSLRIDILLILTDRLTKFSSNKTEAR